MQEYITGYYYGNNYQYIGPFTFHNNLDKEEVHVPPMVTLVKPPESTDILCPFWNPETKAWVLRRNPNIPISAYCWDEEDFTFAGIEDIYDEAHLPANATLLRPVYKKETDVMYWTGKKWSVKK